MLHNLNSKKKVLWKNWKCYFANLSFVHSSWSTDNNWHSKTRFWYSVLNLSLGMLHWGTLGRNAKSYAKVENGFYIVNLTDSSKKIWAVYIIPLSHFFSVWLGGNLKPGLPNLDPILYLPPHSGSPLFHSNPVAEWWQVF